MNRLLWAALAVIFSLALRAVVFFVVLFAIVAVATALGQCFDDPYPARVFMFALSIVWVFLYSYWFLDG